MKSYFASLIAIITQDLNFSMSVLFRHRHVLNLIVKLSIMHPHVTETLLAKWALIFMLWEFFETRLMHCVTTLQVKALLCWVELILLANWACLMNGFLNAFMIIFYSIWDATSTCITVKEVLCTTLTTHSTA